MEGYIVVKFILESIFVDKVGLITSIILKVRRGDKYV